MERRPRTVIIGAVGVIVSAALSVAVNVVTAGSWPAKVGSAASWIVFSILLGAAIILALRQAGDTALPTHIDSELRAALDLAERHAGSVPSLLPHMPVVFVDRTDECDAISVAQGRQRRRRRRATLIAIYGMAGVGKTALAVQAAHQLSAKRAVKALYLNLEGVGDIDVSSALGSLLRQVRPANAQLPSTLEERRIEWLRATADQNVVIVFDGAGSASQLTPLLPNGAESTTLITSRQPVAAHLADHMFRLQTLPRKQSIDLVITIAGRPDIASSAHIIDEICQLCGDLPLALTISAALLRTHPHWSCESLASRMRLERSRLELLQIEDLSVRASLQTSYDELNLNEQNLLKRIASLGVPKVTQELCGALANCHVEAAGQLLESLAKAQLVEAWDDGKFSLHDLVRLFASEIGSEETAENMESALRAISYGAAAAQRFANYVDLAERADRELAGQDWRAIEDMSHIARRSLQVRGLRFPEDSSTVRAMRWFNDNIDILVGLSHEAAKLGQVREHLGLAKSLRGFMLMTGRVDEFLALAKYGQNSTKNAALDLRTQAAIAYGVALRAAGRPGTAAKILQEALDAGTDSLSAPETSLALRDLGRAFREMGKYADADLVLQRALTMMLESGHLVDAALTHSDMGLLRKETGDLNGAINELEKATALLSLAVSRGLTWPQPFAWAVEQLASAYKRRGDRQLSLNGHLTSFHIFASIGDAQGQGFSMRNLGDLAAAMGAWDLAVGLYQRSLLLLRRSNTTNGISQASLSLAIAQARRGRPFRSFGALYQSLAAGGIRSTVRFGVLLLRYLITKPTVHFREDSAEHDGRGLDPPIP